MPEETGISFEEEEETIFVSFYKHTLLLNRPRFELLRHQESNRLF